MITLKCHQEIGIHIIHEVYLERKKKELSIMDSKQQPSCDIVTIYELKTNQTCRSPCPSALNVTEGGSGSKIIWMLDPGHSRSSIASFNAAD